MTYHKTMFKSQPSTAIARTCWGLVLGLVLAIRLMVPAGYMPAWDNGPAIVACDEYAASIPGHRGISEHGKTDKGSNKQPCPYAVVASMAADQPPPVTTDFGYFTAGPITTQQRLVAIGRGLAAPPPPPTGPPLA